MTTCRSCHAPIRWAYSAKNNKLIPLDVDPVFGGNITLRHVAGGAAPIAEVVWADPSIERYVSHFVTCPNANEHRRKR